MRRPMVGIALSVLAGVWLGFALTVPFVWLCAGFALFALAGATAIWLSRRPARATAALWATMCLSVCGILAGWLAAALSQAAPAHDLFDEAARLENGSVGVWGRVAGEPAEVQTLGNTTVREFPLRVSRVRTGTGPWTDVGGGRINVRWYGPSAGRGPAYGEMWELNGGIRRRTQRSSRESHSLLTGRRSSRRVSAGRWLGLARQCLAGRNLAADRLTIGIEDFGQTRDVLQALLLGYRTSLGSDVRNLFAATGTAHIFAISGLHRPIMT